MGGRTLRHGGALDVVFTCLDCFGRFLDHGVERDVERHFVDDKLGRALGGRMGRVVYGIGVHRATGHQTHPASQQHARVAKAFLGEEQVGHGRNLACRLGAFQLAVS